MRGRRWAVPRGWWQRSRLPERFLLIPDLIRDRYSVTPAQWFANKPGVARRQVTFFCVAKRKSPKKRRPDGLGPFASLRATAVLGKSGVSLELAFGSDNREP